MRTIPEEYTNRLRTLESQSNGLMSELSRLMCEESGENVKAKLALFSLCKSFRDGKLVFDEASHADHALSLACKHRQFIALRYLFEIIEPRLLSILGSNEFYEFSTYINNVIDNPNDNFSITQIILTSDRLRVCKDDIPWVKRVLEKFTLTSYQRKLLFCFRVDPKGVVVQTQPYHEHCNLAESKDYPDRGPGYVTLDLFKMMAFVANMLGIDRVVVAPCNKEDLYLPIEWLQEKKGALTLEDFRNKLVKEVFFPSGIRTIYFDVPEKYVAPLKLQKSVSVSSAGIFSSTVTCIRFAPNGFTQLAEVPIKPSVDDNPLIFPPDTSCFVDAPSDVHGSSIEAGLKAYSCNKKARAYFKAVLPEDKVFPGESRFVVMGQDGVTSKFVF